MTSLKSAFKAVLNNFDKKKFNQFFEHLIGTNSLLYYKVILLEGRDIAIVVPLCEFLCGAVIL